MDEDLICSMCETLPANTALDRQRHIPPRPREASSTRSRSSARSTALLAFSSTRPPSYRRGCTTALSTSSWATTSSTKTSGKLSSNQTLGAIEVSLNSLQRFRNESGRTCASQRLEMLQRRNYKKRVSMVSADISSI